MTGEEQAQAIAQELDQMLRNSTAFASPVTIEGVQLSGKPLADAIEVSLSLHSQPDVVYALCAHLIEWQNSGIPGVREPKPRDIAQWIYVAIVEEVDASPGLPPPEPGSRKVTISLDDAGG